MQRMTGIDPMFVYSDTPLTPMEVAYICVFDPVTAPVHDAVRASSPMPARQSHARLGFFEAFGHAYRGLLHAMAQRNMKFHVVSAVLVGLVGSGMPLGLAEKVTLIFCIMLVFFAELCWEALSARALSSSGRPTLAMPATPIFRKLRRVSPSQ